MDIIVWIHMKVFIKMVVSHNYVWIIPEKMNSKSDQLKDLNAFMTPLIYPNKSSVQLMDFRTTQYHKYHKE